MASVEDEEKEMDNKNEDEEVNQDNGKIEDQNKSPVLFPSDVELIPDTDPEDRNRKRQKSIQELNREILGSSGSSEELIPQKKTKTKKENEVEVIEKKKDGKLDQFGFVVSKPKKKFYRKNPSSKFSRKQDKESSSPSSEDEQETPRKRKQRTKKRDTPKRRKPPVWDSNDEKTDPNYFPSAESEDDNDSEDAAKSDKQMKTDENDSDVELTDLDEEKKVKPKKRDPKQKGKYSRQKIECPRCKKILSKSGPVLRKHYKAYHDMVPEHEKEEDIKIVTKKTMRPRKDGTPTGENIAKKDPRRRRKTCVYCKQDFSESHLRADHHRLGSKNMCPEIPQSEVAKARTEEEKKQFTADAIKRSEKTKAEAPKKLKELYAGETYFTVDELLDKAYNFATSYHGKHHLTRDMRHKLAKRQPLDPEERRIHYRPMADKHQQKRVMDHIFGDKPFKLDEIDEVCKWMGTHEREDAFMASRLVAHRRGEGREKPLTHSTINSLSYAMMELLKFIIHTYSDTPVKEAAARALASVKNIAKTSAKHANQESARKGYMEKDYYLVDMEDMVKYLKSKALASAIDHARRMLAIRDMRKRETEAYGRYTGLEVFELQCHLAILLTLHTGKRSGVLCGIKIGDVSSKNKEFKKFVAESDRGVIDPTTGKEKHSYQFMVAPRCEMAMFKTVPVAYVNVSEEMAELLQILAFLRITVDRASPEDRLFSSKRKYPLMTIDGLVKQAWSDGGCESRFSSTMVRHTIVTKAREPERNLSVDELKALALGMDHSVKTAERVYYHGKEKRQVNNALVIQNVLSLNGKMEGWEKEVEDGKIEDIEEDIMDGTISLDDNRREVEDETDEEDMAAGKKKVGNRCKIYTTKEANLIKRMYAHYIDARTENENSQVRYSDMAAIYNQQMKKLPQASPYAVLLRFGPVMISNKVRSLITASRRRKATKVKKEELRNAARLPWTQSAKGKGKGKGKSSNPKLD